MIAVLLSSRAVDHLPLSKTEVVQAAICCGCLCRVVRLPSITWTSLCSPAEAWPSCSSLPWQTARQMQGVELHVPSNGGHGALQLGAILSLAYVEPQAAELWQVHPAGPSTLLRLRWMATANGSCSSGLLGGGGKPEHLPQQSLWPPHRL